MSPSVSRRYPAIAKAPVRVCLIAILKISRCVTERVVRQPIHFSLGGEPVARPRCNATSKNWPLNQVASNKHTRISRAQTNHQRDRPHCRFDRAKSCSDLYDAHSPARILPRRRNLEHVSLHLQNQ